MNEPRKTALVLLIVMAIGLIVLAVEWLRMRLNGYFWLLIVSLILLALALSLHPVRAHDAHRPELNGWYPTLRNKTNDPCCDGSEARHLADVDWETKDGHYRVRLDDGWVDVPEDAVIGEPNRDGRTLVWPTWRDGKRAVRCFMPGALI